MWKVFLLLSFPLANIHFYSQLHAHMDMLDRVQSIQSNEVEKKFFIESRKSLNVLSSYFLFPLSTHQPLTTIFFEHQHSMWIHQCVCMRARLLPKQSL